MSSSTPQLQMKTRMFARVLGPYLVVVTGTAAVQVAHMRTLLTEFGSNSAWPWVTGAFVLLSGLVVIALHQYWRAAAAIIVSFLGWVTALKGLFLVTFPQIYISAANNAIDAVNWWRPAYVAIALVGLYLTYVGWAPARRRTREPTSSTPDLPRAA